MSEIKDLNAAPAASRIECIDPEKIVIALPRRGQMNLTGGVHTLLGDRTAGEQPDDFEPVLAD